MAALATALAQLVILGDIEAVLEVGSAETAARHMFNDTACRRCHP